MFFFAYSGFFKIPDLGPNWLHLLLAVTKLIKFPKNICNWRLRPNFTGQFVRVLYHRICRRAKIFYLPQPGIEPRTLDLQANTLPRRCKSRLLPQGSRSVFIYLDPVTYTPSNLKFVPEFLGTGITWNETKGDILHRTVIGWVIYSGRHCRRANIFYLPQPGIEPRTLDLQANTLPRRCKSRLLPQGSRSVFIYLDPVTHMRAVNAQLSLHIRRVSSQALLPELKQEEAM